MKLLLRILFGQPAPISRSEELDEREQELAEQQRRLAHIRHLRRERDLYRKRERPT